MWKLEEEGSLLCGRRKLSKIVICHKGKAELAREERGYLAWEIPVLKPPLPPRFLHAIYSTV